MGLGQFGEYLQPVFAIGVVKTNEAGRFDARFDHMANQSLGDDVVVLSGFEYPFFLCSHGQDDGGCSNRSEAHTSELPSLMRLSYAVFCSNKTTNHVNSNPLHTRTLT